MLCARSISLGIVYDTRGVAADLEYCGTLAVEQQPRNHQLGCHGALIVHICLRQLVLCRLDLLLQPGRQRVCTSVP